LFPAIGAGGFLIAIKMFTMPLLTRNPAELVIILGPNRATVLKVKQKTLPYFQFRKSLYWFAEPIPVGHNLVHVYFEGVNQPITSLERNKDKISNLIGIRDNDKQIAKHQVIIPPSIKSFTKSWVLVLKNNTIELMTSKEAGLKGKQRYKIGVLKRIGIYQTVTQEQTLDNASASAHAELQQITLQTVLQKLGDVVKGGNFNSRYSYKLLRKIRHTEINWIRMLTGAFDWRIIMVIVIIIAIAALMYFLSQQFSPGAPPPGVKLGK
jgi:hypothetical protein